MKLNSELERMLTVKAFAFFRYEIVVVLLQFCLTTFWLQVMVRFLNSRHVAMVNWTVFRRQSKYGDNSKECSGVGWEDIVTVVTVYADADPLICQAGYLGGNVGQP